MHRQARQPIVTKSAGIRLTNPVQRGDDVGGDVEGRLSWQLDFEPCSLAEETR